MIPATSLTGGGNIRPSFGPAGGGIGKSKVSGYKYSQLPTLSPEQMDFFRSLLGSVQPGAQSGVNFLSRLSSGDSDLFEQLEAPYFTNLQKAGAQLGSRFSQLSPGAMSAQQSSGFQNALAGTAGELAEKLASQRLSLQQNAISELLGLSKSLLGTPLHENILTRKQKSPGFLDYLGQGLGSSFGSLLGFL